MSDPREWRPTWAEAPQVVTIDVVNGAWDTRRQGADVSLQRVEAANAAAVLGLQPKAILAVNAGGTCWDTLQQLATSQGIEFRQVDRREAMAVAATRGFGGACIAIDCGASTTVDFADGARFLAGVSVAGYANPADDASVSEAVDQAIYTTVANAGVDGPLLVITGPDADRYIRSGKLPVQHVPDLIHRGMVELALC